MIPKDFDTNGFVVDLTIQAQKGFPKDLPTDLKSFVISILSDFMKIAAHTLNQEEHFYNEEEIVIICQLIGEWMYHKGIDNYKNGISQEYWKPILQEVALVIFEKAKEGFVNNEPQDNIIDIVERAVNKKYLKLVEQLIAENKITKNIFEINKQSNLKDFIDAERVQESSQTFSCAGTFQKVCEYIKVIDIFHNKNSNRFQNKDKNISTAKDILDFEEKHREKEKIKESQKNIIITVNIFLFILFLDFLLKVQDFKITCCAFLFSIVINIVLLIYINFLKSKLKMKAQLIELENVKQQMGNLVNPDRMYEDLGVDILKIEVGNSLIPITDPEQEGQLLAKTAGLRQKLTNKLGYIIPYIRFSDNQNLGEFQYVIYVRENIVAKGNVYPNRYMIIAEQWDALLPPPIAIVSIEPTWCSKVYWLLPQDIPATVNLTTVAPDDVIITHLEKIVIEHVDEIMTRTNVLKLIELVKECDASLVEEVTKLISIESIRQILVNLVKEEVSIKDILFIFEKLSKYVKFSQEPDVLSEHLRTAFSRQICLKYVNEENILYAVNLSDEWEEVLNASCETTELGQMFSLTPEKITEFVESTATVLVNSHEKIGEQPVLLCNPSIRLALYQLLVQHIPTIVVLSYSELIPDIIVETLDTVR